MNPLVLLGAIPSFIATAVLGFLLHNWDISNIKAACQKHEDKAVADQKLDYDIKIATAQENNNVWVKANNDLSGQYDSVMHSLSVCKRETIKLRSDAATSSISQAYTAGKPIHADAVDIGDLVTYGRDTEQLRQALISCNDAFR